MGRTPYEKTIYLDCDTYVASKDGILDLFSVAEEYDVAGSIDSGRKLGSSRGIEPVPDELQSIPNAFSWINTGVLAYKKKNNVLQFINKWEHYHEEFRSNLGLEELNDQAAFRYALYHSDLRHATLPPEYNFRTPWPQSVRGRVHILHGEDSNMPDIEKVVNSDDENTSWRQFNTLSFPDGTRYMFDMSIKANYIKLAYFYLLRKLIKLFQ
jgi:hypothetical protein